MHVTPKPDSLKSEKHPKNFKARYWIYGVRKKQHRTFIFVGLGNSTQVANYFEKELASLNENRHKFSDTYARLIPLTSDECSMVMLGEFETHRDASMYLENYERQLPFAICRDTIPKKD